MSTSYYKVTLWNEDKEKILEAKEIYKKVHDLYDDSVSDRRIIRKALDYYIKN